MQPSPPAMHPELLMAACHGVHTQLANLLNSDVNALVQVQHPTTEAGGGSVVVVVDDVDNPASAASTFLLQGLTPHGDSALHVAATFGDGDEYLKSAKVIYGNGGRHLLGAHNNEGNTPFHCAARAANTTVLTLLIDLARGEEATGAGGDDAAAGRMRVETLLRMQNKLGETALHGAIRAAHMPTVDALLTADPCLARVPDTGTSPLFLAVSLHHYGIARKLYARDNRLSCSGPDGKNALHAAVLRSKEMTELLLGWNKELTKQRDQHGNTPLHFAVSLESGARGLLPQYAVPVENRTGITTFLNIKEPALDLTKKMLEADPYSAFQADNNGWFPIHVAASAGRLSAVAILVTMCPGCAGLRDIDGRTFLHVAVKKRRYDIVAYACQKVSSSVLNKQDNEGNTAVHLAVEVGDWWIFACLFANKQVDLNLPNNKQHTPRELSIITIPTGLYCLVNSGILIQQALIYTNATRDICRHDGIEKDYTPVAAEDDIIISNSTQFLGLGLVLITTMAFSATFTLPGGYRADDHPNGGTPTLAGLKQFQGFMMANTLALVCSSLAVISLVFSGTPTVELSMRQQHYNISIWLSWNAIISLGIAFAIAVYIMISPIASETAIAVIVVFFSVGILHLPSIAGRFCKFSIVLCARIGILPIVRSDISKVMLLTFWPLIVIYGWQEYAWRHR